MASWVETRKYTLSVSSQNAEATHLHMRSLLELRSHNISWVNYAPCIIHAIHLFISCSQSGSASNGCLEVRIGGSSHGLFNGLMTLRQLLIQGGFYFWPVECVFKNHIAMFVAGESGEWRLPQVEISCFDETSAWTLAIFCVSPCPKFVDVAKGMNRSTNGVVWCWMLADTSSMPAR